MADRYRSAWLPAIRSMVLQGARARYDGRGYLTIKEPHGSVGAPLLVEALPESRVVLLARDPRDAIASDYDTELPGSWWTSRRDAPSLTSDEYDFWTIRSRRYLWDFEMASDAYRAATAPKAIVRYEDLHADTEGELRRLRDDLGLPWSDESIHAAVEKFAWRNVPDDQKGPGRFYRSGEPGAWRRQLSPSRRGRSRKRQRRSWPPFMRGRSNRFLRLSRRRRPSVRGNWTNSFDRHARSLPPEPDAAPARSTAAPGTRHAVRLGTDARRPAGARGAVRWRNRGTPAGPRPPSRWERAGRPDPSATARSMQRGLHPPPVRGCPSARSADPLPLGRSPSRRASRSP